MDLLKDTHPDIQKVLGYYAATPKTGILPGKQHVDPVLMPDLVPRMALISVYHVASEPMRFHIYYAGDEVVKFTGQDMKGRSMTGRLGGKHLLRVRDNLTAVVETKVPTWRKGKPLIRFERNDIELERVLLPLATDGDTVDMLLSFTVFNRRPPQTE